MEWTPIVDCAYDCKITVTTGTTTCAVEIQLKDFAGNNLTVKNCVAAYISTGSTGDTAGTVTSIVKLTNGDVIGADTTVSVILLSESNGLIDCTIDGTTQGSVYLNVILPNGKIVTSGIVTFTS